jgi:hypothetical protein
LKKKNPLLKTLLAVGGWNMGSMIFSDMAINETNRQNFIRSAVVYLRRWNFDGLDLVKSIFELLSTICIPETKEVAMRVCFKLSQVTNAKINLGAIKIEKKHKRRIFLKNKYFFDNSRRQYLSFVHFQ